MDEEISSRRFGYSHGSSIVLHKQFTDDSVVPVKQAKENKSSNTTLKSPRNRDIRPAPIMMCSCGLISMVDTYDRPHTKHISHKQFVRVGTYTSPGFENAAGHRIPKAGAYAETGVAEAATEWSVFHARARGPFAGAYAQALGSSGLSVMATASLASAQGRAGPFAGKVGLSLDTGIGVGPDGLELKLLGFGGSIGAKTSVEVLGNGVSFYLL